MACSRFVVSDEDAGEAVLVVCGLVEVDFVVTTGTRTVGLLVKPLEADIEFVFDKLAVEERADAVVVADGTCDCAASFALETVVS